MYVIIKWIAYGFLALGGLTALMFLHGVWQYFRRRWDEEGPPAASAVAPAPPPARPAERRAEHRTTTVVDAGLFALEEALNRAPVHYVPDLVRSGRFGDRQAALAVLDHLVFRLRAAEPRYLPLEEVDPPDRPFCLPGREAGSLCVYLAEIPEEQIATTFIDPAPSPPASGARSSRTGTLVSRRVA